MGPHFVSPETYLAVGKQRSKCGHVRTSPKMFRWRRSSLKNGWIGDPFLLDYIHVLSCKLTSDSSHSSLFVSAHHKNTTEGFLRALTAGELLACWLLPCIKLEMINMIRKKKSVYASNFNAPQICGNRGVLYRKYCFESATQELSSEITAGTQLPDEKREFKTRLLWPL